MSLIEEQRRLLVELERQWTDSKVILGWLNGDPNKWRPFVANRVRQITEMIPSEQWRYVNSSENPADAASRGLYPSQLLKNLSLWKNGPAWLTTFDTKLWEKQTFTTKQEEKFAKQTNVVLNNREECIIDQLLTKHSSLNKIIPSDSRLATLVINLAHKLTFHGGPRLTLAALRREYWITSGNNTVKKELRKCITCRKNEGQKQQQLMGDLPAPRINPASPFHHTGVDYTGFVEVKRNKGRSGLTLKGYIAIFVCMVTKAVHLEIVSELTSSAFLAALRRMAARRGTPRHIYSDNGTNFVGANKILQEEWKQLKHIFNDSFLTEVTEMEIEWHFNAPAWPSAGGLWERAVRSLKHHLKRVVGQQKLTFEEYSTLLAQIEACLNSRPLCALTENIEDLDYLSPAHFLTGRSGVTMIETGEDARTRWHLTQNIFRDIWKRWKSEYLSQLTSRGKWRNPQQNMKIGDMVVIHDDNIPSGKWALGRVVEVHPGSDDYVRVVTLKTKNNLIKRPVTKLSRLPLEQETEHKSQPDKGMSSKPSRNGQLYLNKGSSFITTALTFLYLISMLTTAMCININTLDKQQGIYFDKLSNIQLIRDEWKIVAYYDLQPYWEGYTALQKYYKHLERVCDCLKRQTHCDIISIQLSHSLNELEHNNRVVLQQYSNERTRRRRGLINGVGYLANSLFGVLDDRFAEQYTKDITLVRNNQKHLALLWKNQTSVIEAEFNLLKRTEATIQVQHKIINKYLISLDNVTKGLVEKINETEFLVEFSLCAIAANNLLIHLKDIQNCLLDTLTNMYYGNLNIHLIDPQQLQKELGIISGQLDKDLTLPIENLQTNMQNIYHLLKVKTKASKQYLIFEIRVPLIDKDSYELYNVIPIPRQMGTKVVTIIPIESHIAINLEKDSYIPMAAGDWDHCLVRDVTTYLCQLKTPIFKLKSDMDLCVKVNNNLCKTIMSTCQNQWIGLTTVNQYLHLCCDHCPIRTICQNQITAETLTGANIIHLSNDCMIKTENFSIFGHKLRESKMNIAANIETFRIAPINNIINLTIPKLVEGNINQTENELLFKEVEDQINNLKKQPVFPEDISIHDVHHYVLIYASWGVAIIVAAVCLCRRVRWRWQAAAASAPTPANPTVLEMTAMEVTRPQQTTCSLYSEPSSSARVHNSESVKNEFRYKDKGTSPISKKIAFSGDSV